VFNPGGSIYVEERCDVLVLVKKRERGRQGAPGGGRGGGAGCHLYIYLYHCVISISLTCLYKINSLMLKQGVKSTSTYYINLSVIGGG
jgi:hypothetical protein